MYAEVACLLQSKGKGGNNQHLGHQGEGNTLKTTAFIDKLRRDLKLPSDYAVAKRLHVRTTTISNYRAGRSTMGEDVAYRVAVLLDMDPGYVMACAREEAARTPELRKAWHRAAMAIKRCQAAVLVLAVCVGLWAPAGRVWAGDWSSADSARQWTYTALHIADWGQTLDIVGRPDEYHETNPLLGEHPSRGKVNRYMATTLAAHWLIASWLPAKPRRAFQYVTLTVEAGMVAHNYRLGVRFNF